MKEYLQEIVNYIEKEYRNKVTLEAIAEHIGFSKFYLNRVFSIYTGMSIMSYVKRKRLELAIDELKKEKRIVDIALDLGYSSERAFSKAIKDAYGHSPSYFRKADILKIRKLVIYDLQLSLEDELFSENSSAEQKNTLKEEGESDMIDYLSDVSYTTMKDMTILSATLFGTEPEEAVMKLMHQLSKEYSIQPIRNFGFDVPVESMENDQNYRGYEFWLVISENDKEKWLNSNVSTYKSQPITLKTIPSYRYATIRIENPFINPFERIPSGWKALAKWLESHDFNEPDFQRCQKAACLEEVTEVNGITVMDIFIPVDKG